MLTRSKQLLWTLLTKEGQNRFSKGTLFANDHQRIAHQCIVCELRRPSAPLIVGASPCTMRKEDAIGTFRNASRVYDAGKSPARYSTR